MQTNLVNEMNEYEIKFDKSFMKFLYISLEISDLVLCNNKLL